MIADEIDNRNNGIQSEENTDFQPTDNELSQYEHVSESIPLSAWLIVICELCERFSYYGLSGPFQNYIEHPPQSSNDTQPGALGRGQQTATALTTFFQFFSYFTPIIGAIIADQYLGKYRTIALSCCTYIVGLLILVLTSIPPSIDRGIAFPGLIISMIIIAFGTGGVKSNVGPLMGEQYTRTVPIVRGFVFSLFESRIIHILLLNGLEIKGVKKIIDPNVTLQSMFNWFYWAINIGALSSILTTNIEKYHSFWLAYLIPLIVFHGAIGVLILGRNRYIRSPPNGSLLLRAAKVFLKAIRIKFTASKTELRPHFLDYAKDLEGDAIEIQFVDDLKRTMNSCKVFLFYPFYWVCYNQLATNLVSQAAQMNVGPLPNDILQNIDPIVLIIFIPIFERIIYPTLRRLKIRFSSIMRITSGFICISLAMAWAAVVQSRIYATGPYYDFTNEKPCNTCQKNNDITVAWQIPTYFFIAISEIFASITGLEYAFTQAPPSLKSIVMSLFLFTSALGSVLNFTLVPVTENPKLLWMYVSLAIMALLVGALFFIVFRDRQKVHTESTE